MNWVCPVHGHANYAGASVRFVACDKCGGSGETFEDGEFDDCAKCEGTGGKRYCEEEIESSEPRH
jgi:DnaJ-class molecular chaperone